MHLFAQQALFLDFQRYLLPCSEEAQIAWCMSCWCPCPPIKVRLFIRIIFTKRIPHFQQAKAGEKAGLSVAVYPQEIASPSLWSKNNELSYGGCCAACWPAGYELPVGGFRAFSRFKFHSSHGYERAPKATLLLVRKSFNAWTLNWQVAIITCVYQNLLLTSMFFFCKCLLFNNVNKQFQRMVL